MPALRRYTLYFGLAICIIYLFSRFNNPIPTVSRQSPIIEHDPSVSYQIDPESFLDPETGVLRWDQVPVRYPPKGLTSLPRGFPRALHLIQHEFPEETEAHATLRKQRQQAVKSAFERCWKAYKTHAWMKDEVAPVSGQSSDFFGGWAATLVDSLDTLWIMDMKSDFEEAVTAAMDIDLGLRTTEIINVFETTIRHLGGFLSAYDLSGDKRLLQKAREFGEMLLVAFDTPNRMPITRWNPDEFFQQPQTADTRVLVAEMGSLSLEFTRLSILTGDPKWFDAIMRIYRHLEEQQYDTFLPGMWPVTINAARADFASDSLFTLSGMADSLYEYFAKMHALIGGTELMFEKMYEGSTTTAIRYNLFRPMTPDNADILISGQIRKTAKNSRTQLDPQGQHLACFTGGMFAIGSRVFRMPSHLDIAKKLTDGCVWTYKNMPMGIMPEKFRMAPCQSKSDCVWNETRWKEYIEQEHPGMKADEAIEKRRIPKGFTEIVDRRYGLRPEAIESVFILYRVTGDVALLDTAWEMFTSIVEATKTDLANTALNDISFARDVVDLPSIQADSMESFWMAETLKYFYLIFSEPHVISLDEWVLNTEAHPLRRRLPDELLGKI